MIQEAPSPDMAPTLVALRKALDIALESYQTKPFKDILDQLAQWEKEDRLVFKLRDCIFRKFVFLSYSRSSFIFFRDCAGLTATIQIVRESGASINLERPRRVVEKLHKEVIKSNLLRLWRQLIK